MSCLFGGRRRWVLICCRLWRERGTGKGLSDIMVSFLVCIVAKGGKGKKGRVRFWCFLVLFWCSGFGFDYYGGEGSLWFAGLVSLTLDKLALALEAWVFLFLLGCFCGWSLEGVDDTGKVICGGSVGSFGKILVYFWQSCLLLC